MWKLEKVQRTVTKMLQSLKKCEEILEKLKLTTLKEKKGR